MTVPAIGESVIPPIEPLKRLPASPDCEPQIHDRMIYRGVLPGRSPEAAGLPEGPPPDKICELPPPEKAFQHEAPPTVLDLSWSERQERKVESKKPSAPPDPEQDYQEAQKIWMEILTGRLKHQEDLQAIARDAQLYIFQSIQESYQRQVKAQQKAMEAWLKMFLDD